MDITSNYNQNGTCKECTNKIICKHYEERIKLDKKIEELKKEYTINIFSIKCNCVYYSSNTNLKFNHIGV